MSDIQGWWNSIPFVTKWLFAGSFGLTLAGNFGLVPGMSLVLVWDQVIKNFQVWRIVTCFFFYGRLGFPFLMNMAYLYRYSQSLENTVFQGRTADYIFFVLFGSTLIMILATFFGQLILGVGIIFMIIYYWSRKNPNEVVTFMFGLKFQSMYLPWVLMGFNLLLGGFPLTELLGVLAGHAYLFLDQIYPETGGRRLLKTPQFLYDFFPTNNPYVNRPPQGAARFQGQGYTLRND